MGSSRQPILSSIYPNLLAQSILGCYAMCGIYWAFILIYCREVIQQWAFILISCAEVLCIPINQSFITHFLVHFPITFLNKKCQCLKPWFVAVKHSIHFYCGTKFLVCSWILLAEYWQSGSKLCFACSVFLWMLSDINS